jgi:predicted ATPase/DNA-binding XRE family transcriptional regulator
MAATLGALLTGYRERAGISRAELARLSGVDEATLGAIEHAIAPPPAIPVVHDLAAALALNTEETATLLAARGEAETGPPPAAGAPTSSPPTTLIGRAKEIETILRLLHTPEIRLLTLTGPGGTGKTRLALAVVERMGQEDLSRDGMHFVDLTSTDDPGLVPGAISRGLGLRVVERPVAEALADYLRPRHVVLVLDNFEQVIEAATTIGAMLADAPNLKMLVTSRERLRIAAEHVYQVPPLPLNRPAPQVNQAEPALSEAGQLFVARARAAVSSLTVTTDMAAAIEDICQRVDGLPLAIELAAARVATFPPATLLARLDRSLPILARGPRDAPARLRSMRDAIAWSYDLLDETEQRLFRLLSIFVGGWSLAAAVFAGQVHIGVAAGGSADNIVDGLASLVEKSLVQVAGGDGDEVRFTILQTVREFGLEQLELLGESETASRAHLRYFEDLAARAEPNLSGRDQARWLDLLEREFPNIQSAVIWAGEHDAVEEGVWVVVRLWRLWSVRVQVAEGRRLLEGLLEQREQLPMDALAMALAIACQFAQFQGDYIRAMAMGEEGMALARACGNAHIEARALDGLGATCHVQNRFSEAVHFLEQSLAIFETLDEPQWSASVAYTLGDTLRDLGQTDRARVHLESALATARSVDDVLEVAWSLNYLADMART